MPEIRQHSMSISEIEENNFPSNTNNNSTQNWQSDLEGLMVTTIHRLGKCTLCK